MEKKYWVPAVERANNVLLEISKSPNQLKLIDISKKLDINKSSLFSLLNTLEVLGWIVKTSSDTYKLGPSLGRFSSAYLSQFNLVQNFHKEAEKSVLRINETIQLGILDEKDVVYLGKVNSSNNVRLVTDPGMRFPAYATAIGKVQMLEWENDYVYQMFKDTDWELKTKFTTSSVEDLVLKIEDAKQKGYVVENEESAIGFHCVAAPIYNHENQIIAGVSFSMPTDSWNDKFENAKKEIIDLATRLSMLAGYSNREI